MYIIPLTVFYLDNRIRNVLSNIYFKKGEELRKTAVFLIAGNKQRNKHQIRFVICYFVAHDSRHI